jgi:hypothetical protein
MEQPQHEQNLLTEAEQGFLQSLLIQQGRIQAQIEAALNLIHAQRGLTGPYTLAPDGKSLIPAPQKDGGNASR